MEGLSAFVEIGLIVIIAAGVFLFLLSIPGQESKDPSYIDSVRFVNILRKEKEAERLNGKLQVLREGKSEVPQSDSGSGVAGQVKELDPVGAGLHGGNGTEVV